MVSWAIVGATRGIGFEYVKQLSNSSDNTVIALIRSQNTAGPVNELASQRKNIHVLEMDVTKPATLKETANEIGQITDGKLDVLIYNAYSAGTENMTLAPSAFADRDPNDLERELFESLRGNVLYPMYAINAFLPLVQAGAQKKVIYISSGNGDVELIRKAEIPGLIGYSASKAAGNIVMAKYAVELKPQGIKTLSLSPGWVDTDEGKAAATPEEVIQWLLAAFQKVKPSVTGRITTDESVRKSLTVINSLNESNSGVFLSQNGDRDWF